MRIIVEKDHQFIERRNWVVRNVLRPILYVLGVLSSALSFTLKSEAAALAGRLNAGYSPASNLTNNLTQTQVNYYDKNFVNSGDLAA